MPMVTYLYVRRNALFLAKNGSLLKALVVFALSDDSAVSLQSVTSSNHKLTKRQLPAHCVHTCLGVVKNMQLLQGRLVGRLVKY